MMHAYNEIYLERARSVMAHMFDYAVHGLGYNLKDFFESFLVSPLCAKFERGDASIIAGRSGVELACEVSGVWDATDDVSSVMHRTPEFWLGWALAYYQWHSMKQFSEIVQSVSIEDMLQMYSKYHEMDILHFVECIDKICHRDRMLSRLKKYRLMVGLSQRELADETGIPLRTIQQYEQGQKNINKAQVDYIIRLSRALYCQPQDILEEIR